MKKSHELRAALLSATLAVPVAVTGTASLAQSAEELMTQQFGGIVDDAVIKETFDRLAQPITPEIREKALECYRASSCETGTGGQISVAYADGFGENVWRQVTRMEFILQALTYPEIGKIQYVSARGDVSKAISDMSAYIAQGVNVIVIYPDAGEAMRPIIQEATESGIKVVLHNGPVVGTAGKDYLTNVREDTCALGKAFIDAVKEGNPEATSVVALGGTPGNTLSATWQACSETEAAAKGVEILTKLDTNWTQEGTFNAVTSALAQYGDVQGWIYEYADGFRGAVRAYEAAGKPMNTVAALRTDEQGVFCDWEAAGNADFKLYYSSAFNVSTRIGLTAAMMSLAGADVPAEIQLPFSLKPVVAGLCNPELPMETSVSTTVDKDMLKAMFTN